MYYHNTGKSVQDSARAYADILAKYSFKNIFLCDLFEEHVTVVSIFILGLSSHFGDGKGYIKPPYAYN